MRVQHILKKYIVYYWKCSGFFLPKFQLSEVQRKAYIWQRTEHYCVSYFYEEVYIYFWMSNSKQNIVNFWDFKANQVESVA